ncbi:MAG TPA: MFS transporter [Chloroflexia bacterium]|nr:MFS transporter [Chloroflexia bacterium]
MSKRISPGLLLLGLVGVLAGAGSGMVAPLRVLFLAVVLYTPVSIIGLIEGLAASVACVLPTLITHKPTLRKPLLLLGYALSAAGRPLLALVGGWTFALFPILLDHAGKGVRFGLREGVIAASATPGKATPTLRFHCILSLFGVVIGVLIAAILLLANFSLREILLWSVVPGSLALLAFAIFLLTGRKAAVEGHIPSAQATPSIPPHPALALGTRFWMFAAISTLASLGTLSSGVFVLRAASLEQSFAGVAFIYLAYALLRALLAVPLGALRERWGYLPVLMSGYGVMIIVYLGFTLAADAWNMWALFSLYALYAAFTSGVWKAFLADLVPEGSRGRALSWYMGLTGTALLPANAIAGWLWTVGGPSATFSYAMWVTILAIGLTVAWLPWLRRGYPVETNSPRTEPDSTERKEVSLQWDQSKPA